MVTRKKKIDHVALGHELASDSIDFIQEWSKKRGQTGVSLATVMTFAGAVVAAAALAAELDIKETATVADKTRDIIKLSILQGMRSQQELAAELSNTTTH